MTVRANGNYDFATIDGQDAFRGAMLVYAGWNRHMMFASPYVWPLPPDMPFGEFVAGPMAQAFAQHPDWERIDWARTEWTRNGEPFSPALGKSLSDNGILHKDSLKFTAMDGDGIPLNGIGGAGI